MNIALNGCCILLMLYAVIMVSKRVFVHSRDDQKGNSNNTKITPYEPPHQTSFKIFGIAILFRILLIALGIFIYYTFVQQQGHINYEEILKSLHIWDARHYIYISHGYASYTPNGEFTELVFFPLYPLLIRIFYYLAGNDVLSGLCVSIVAFALACVYFYKLVCLDFAKEVAQKALIFLCVFPTSFFFGLVMSESLFLLLSVLTLYHIRKHHWWLVGIFGCLAALTKYVGVFLVFPAFVEVLEEYHVFKNIKNWKYLLKISFQKLVPLILIPCGTLIFLYINYRVSGDALYFLKVQAKKYHQETTPFYQILQTISHVIFHGGNSIKAKLFFFVSGFIIITVSYFVLTRICKKYRSMYTVWLIAYIICNTSMSWPLSIARYFCCAIPLFIYAGDVCTKKEKLYPYAISVLSILLGIFYTGFFNKLIY